MIDPEYPIELFVVKNQKNYWNLICKGYFLLRGWWCGLEG